MSRSPDWPVADTSRSGPRHSRLTPVSLSQGILPPTGNRMDAPCCDVFKLQNGKLQLFNCYPSGTVILSQLGVLGDLGTALQRHASV
jgi:hypothetical protein